MDKYTQRTQVTCDIVTEVNTRPRLFHRLNRRPIPTVKETANETDLELASGNIETYRLGEDAQSITLALKKINKEGRMFLRELRRRGMRVYVYPYLSGALQGYYPLLKGVGGDPSDATFTGEIEDDTTVYIPRADAGFGWYLEEYDYDDGAFLSSIPTSTGVSSELSLGRGVVLLRPRENSVENSLFGDVTSGVPANWSYTEGASPPTTAGVITDGWMGVPALWTSDRHFQWRSDVMTCPPAGTFMALSYGWRCDGIIQVTVDFVGAGSEDFTHTEGSGYEHQTVEVPVGATGVRLCIDLQPGDATYGEFTAPQLIKSDAADIRYYPAFMGSSGTDTTGEITDTELTATGHFGADVDTAVMVSGVIAPLFPEDKDDRARPLFRLSNSNSGSTISCCVKEETADTKIAIYQDGVSKATASFTHELGKEYAVVFIAGFVDSGTYKMQAKIREIGSSTTVTAEATSSLVPYIFFDTLEIGSENDSDNTANSVIQEIIVSACDYSDGDDAVEHLANSDAVDMGNMTRGKLYSIETELSPSAWERGYHDGKMTCKQVKVL